jgi:hypothetical protein
MKWCREAYVLIGYQAVEKFFDFVQFLHCLGSVCALEVSENNPQNRPPTAMNLSELLASKLTGKGSTKAIGVISLFLWLLWVSISFTTFPTSVTCEPSSMQNTIQTSKNAKALGQTKQNAYAFYATENDYLKMVDFAFVRLCNSSA